MADTCIRVSTPDGQQQLVQASSSAKPASSTPIKNAANICTFTDVKREVSPVVSVSQAIKNASSICNFAEVKREISPVVSQAPSGIDSGRK